MSVIHFGPEKFQRIDKTLKLMYGRDLGHVFGYPDGWDKRDGLHGHITAFLLVDNAGRESSINDCWGRLDSLIDFITNKIISAMPEWNAADTWAD